MDGQVFYSQRMYVRLIFNHNDHLYMGRETDDMLVILTIWFDLNRNNEQYKYKKISEIN